MRSSERSPLFAVSLAKRCVASHAADRENIELAKIRRDHMHIFARSRSSRATSITESAGVFSSERPTKSSKLNHLRSTIRLWRSACACLIAPPLFRNLVLLLFLLLPPPFPFASTTFSSSSFSTFSSFSARIVELCDLQIFSWVRWSVREKRECQTWFFSLGGQAANCHFLSFFPGKCQFE